VTDYAYHLVDVFTDRPFSGNQLAVFPEASRLTDNQMQAIARELNLSETSFVFPPDDASCQFKVRIFTPARELPMAGHPTLGTAYVLSRLGLIAPGGTAAFQEGVGRITVEVSPTGAVWMQQPAPQFGRTYANTSGVAHLLGISTADIVGNMPCQVVSTGVPFLLVPLLNLAAAQRAWVNAAQWDGQVGDEAAGVYVFTGEVVGNKATLHARMFGPAVGIAEDPATGGAAGPLAAYMWRYLPEGPVQQFIEQGLEMGRRSLLETAVVQEGDRMVGVRVGGPCVAIGEGRLFV